MRKTAKFRTAMSVENRNLTRCKISPFWGMRRLSGVSLSLTSWLRFCCDVGGFIDGRLCWSHMSRQLRSDSYNNARECNWTAFFHSDEPYISRRADLKCEFSPALWGRGWAVVLAPRCMCARCEKARIVLVSCGWHSCAAWGTAILLLSFGYFTFIISFAFIFIYFFSDIIWNLN